MLLRLIDFAATWHIISFVDWVFFWGGEQRSGDYTQSRCSEIIPGSVGGTNYVSHVQGKCPIRCAIAFPPPIFYRLLGQKPQLLQDCIESFFVSYLKDGKNKCLCQKFCSVINLSLPFKINKSALILSASIHPKCIQPFSGKKKP